MKWEGNKIKALAKEKGISLKKIAGDIGVSRQTVNDWVNGQIPKANHLISLCAIFHVNPENFFTDDTPQFIKCPVHRVRLSAKVNPEMQSSAISLCKKYLNFFKAYRKSLVIPVVRIQEANQENAVDVAAFLRELSGIAQDKPIDYMHTFMLAKKLGINIIFRKFPRDLKNYAFYTKICNHRVIFVNTSTNILDLIFPLLHEYVHAIKDEGKQETEYSSEEEKFCDLVANLIQFPETYVKMVYDAVDGLGDGVQIKKLKQFGGTNKHSIHGIIEAIKLHDFRIDLKYGGADTNLKKDFPTVAEILFAGDPRDFVTQLRELSGSFYSILLNEIKNISSNRILAELLGLESPLDAKEIRSEIMRDLSFRN